MANSKKGPRLPDTICGLALLFLLSGEPVLATPPGSHPISRTPYACRETAAAAESDLPSFLGRAADYCDRLSGAVLNFVCRERIEEWFYTQKPADLSSIERLSGMDFIDPGIIFIDHKEKYRYIYDYQLVRDRAGHIRESRALLEEHGKKVEIPDAPLKTHTFKHAYVVMGPLGLLSRNHQADFEYRIAGKEKVGGEPAVIIEARPKPGVHPDYLFGTIWLRQRDANVLKIQWNPSSIENYEALENEARQFKRKPDIVMTSEYAFEKNGIRFPSRYTVKENYVGRHGGHFRRSETDVSYDQYKFFTVETEVKF